jgi:hypothetical protein
MPEAEPAPVTPLEGKTTVDDRMLFEPTRLSYQSADRITKQIASNVRAAVRDKLVVIVGVDLLADLANVNATVAILDSLKRDYQSLSASAKGTSVWRALVRSASPEETGREPEPEGKAEEGARSLAVAPVLAGVQTALGLVSLFRADVDYRGAETTVDPQTFDLALAARLKENGASKVLVPNFTIFPAGQQGQSSLRAALEAVQEAKEKAWNTIGPAISELVRLEAELDRAITKKSQARVDELSARLSELRRDMDPITAPLARLDQRLSDLEARWDQSGEPTGLTMLARLLRAEAIFSLKPRPLFLHAKVVSSGGHLRTTRSLWRMIFLGDGLSAMGGVVVRWALLGKDGAIVQGGIASSRQGARFPLPSSDPLSPQFPSSSLQGTHPKKDEHDEEDEQHGGQSKVNGA